MKVAVIAFNPVNGLGLFQYLESFFENGISYDTFSLGDTNVIKTNSGIEIKLDGKISDLKGREAEYDALVFACGDAMLKFGEIAGKEFIKDAFAAIARFNALNKIIVGHCAAAAIFEMAGVTAGCKVAIHPFGKPSIVSGIATDNKIEVDGHFYTAQNEDCISLLLPELLKELKR